MKRGKFGDPPQPADAAEGSCILLTAHAPGETIPPAGTIVAQSFKIEQR